MSRRWLGGFITVANNPLVGWTAFIPTYGLWTVGDNTSGQLGDSTVVNKSSPVQISSASWLSISAGFRTIAGIKGGGTLWTCGRNNEGKLGQGDVVSRSSPVQVGALTTWSAVSSPSGATNAVLALKTDGTLWAWGANQFGNIGDNTAVAKSSPVQVGALTTWAAISTGYNQNFAIKTDGTLWGWGYNGLKGALGVGTAALSDYRSSPVQVGALTTWANVSSGFGMGAARKTDGTIWGWGYNTQGQVGDNTAINRSSPVQIGALTTWAKISGSYGTFFGIKTDGTLWSWGRNTVGQCGQNTAVNISSPIQVGALTTWRDASCSFSSAAATRTDNTLWVWGANSSGGLGQNNTTAVSSPVQVGGATWKSQSTGQLTTNALSL